ncbi:hypothetical protein K440DRAFT_631044 [Wilcoxina mikolae CBS 423.85]|nr:hypothetical protein K440DRAFT_631044 [Wilcoxina mikolae CBS 423.85]
MQQTDKRATPHSLGVFIFIFVISINSEANGGQIAIFSSSCSLIRTHDWSGKPATPPQQALR